jgi:hypothetical protein
MRNRACAGAAIVLLLGLSSGCWYGRVGTSSHQQFYRGTVGDVGRAVESAFARHGYLVTHESRGEALFIRATTVEKPTLSATVRVGKEGLAEARLGSEIDWRKAGEVHRWIATELGVLYRGEP